MQIWSAEIKELESLYTLIKGRFPGLEKELEQLIKFDDANVILIYSRRCLEVIVSDLCINELKRPRKTEPLKGIIDKLSHEDKVPSNIIASMEGLNSLSTFGAHPKDFDPEQVKPVLSNLAIIIKWYLKHKDSQTISKVKAEEKLTIGEIKVEEEKDESKSPFITKENNRKPKVILILLLSGILVAAAIIAYPKIFKRDTLENLRSKGKFSIAVMPFQNMTNDSSWSIYQDVIQENVINYLTSFPDELIVRQTESINNLIQSKGITNYASITPNIAKTISQKLNTDVFIYGSIQHAGTKLRVNANLIDAKTEEILKSFEIDGLYNEEIIFDITDSLRKNITDFLILSVLRKDVAPFRQCLMTTNSSEAYRYFRYGEMARENRDFPTARDWYFKALSIDSNFFYVIRRIAQTYEREGLFNIGKEWILKYYGKRDQMPIGLRLRACNNYASYFETPYERIKYSRQLVELDDQDAGSYIHLGDAYSSLNQYDKAIPEYEKSLELHNKLGLEYRDNLYYGLGYAYHETGQYRKEKKLYKKAEQAFPGDDIGIIYRQAILSLSVGKTNAADEYIKKFMAICKNSYPEASITGGVAEIYREAGILDKAEEYYRQALSLEPENPARINNLAYFLIDKDRNINEGLELVDKSLELNPENHNYLHTKGWGLYKQGKYHEALELLGKSWELKIYYDHQIYLHLEATKKAVASQNK